MLQWIFIIIVLLVLSGCFGDSNQAPKIISTAPTAVIETGQKFQYNVKGSDINNDPLTYSLCGTPPAGAMIDSDSGLLSWTASGLGDFEFCVQVNDGAEGVAQQNFTVSVSESQTPVLTLSQQSLDFGLNDAAKNFELSNTGDGTLDWTISENETWLSVSPSSGSMTSATDTISVTVNRLNLVRGLYTGSVAVASNAGNDTVSVSMQVPNHIPQITSTPSTLSIESGESFQYDVNGSDIDNDTLTYSLCGTPPAGAMINSSSGLLSWTSSGSGNVTFCVQANDEYEGAVQQNFTLSVGGTQTTPVLTLSQQSLDFGLNDTTKSFELSNTGDGTLGWTISDNKNWLSVSPTAGNTTSATDTINVTVNRLNLVRGVYTGSVTVTSNAGNDTVSVSMQVPNNKPQITSSAPSTLSIESGAAFQYDVNGSDIDNDTLTYSLCGTPPSGATINSSSGLFSWTASGSGDVAFCVQVSDGNAGAAQQSFVVTVNEVQSEISVSEENLSFGTEATSKTFTITNTGGGSLSWVLTRDPRWIRATPPSGSVGAGESKVITVTVDRSGLDIGTHEGHVNIAYNSKNRVVSVGMEVDGSIDTEAPNNTTVDDFVNSGDSSTSSSSVILSLLATDNIGVTETFIKDQKCSVSAPANPIQSSEGWIRFSTHQSYNFTGSYISGDEVCVSVWFRDAAGNISSVKSDEINLLISGDSSAPYDVSLTLDGGATSTSSRTVTLGLSAKDDNGVVAYYVSENSTPPNVSDAAWVNVTATQTYSENASFTLSNNSGTKTVHGWFKDAADNLSNSANDVITYNEPSTGGCGGSGSTVFDVDLTTGNAGSGVQTGGVWENGWRVTDNNQRIVFDAGCKIKNGYVEATFTIDRVPWAANPTGNMSKNNYFGAYESSSLSHFEPGSLLYMRQGKESYDFGVWKAGFGNLVDRLNDYEGFMEAKLGDSTDWITDDTTLHTVKMTWQNGDVFYSGTGDGTTVVWHDVLREGGYRVDDIQYGYIGLDKSYGDNRGVPGLRFKSFKMVDLGQ